MRSGTCVVTVALLLGALEPLRAIDPDRDFTGEWVLDPATGNPGTVSTQRDRALSVLQRDTVIHCSSDTGNRAARWTYALDGSETRYPLGEETRKSVTKWEGAALLINTLVSGPRNYTVMDRWRLSRDHAVLSITRQVVTASGSSEGMFVYRREGSPAPAPAPGTTPKSRSAPAPESRSRCVIRWTQSTRAKATGSILKPSIPSPRTAAS